MEEIAIEMKAVVFYDATGRISSCAKLDTRSLAAAGANYLEVDEVVPTYDATHYVKKGALTERPRMNVTTSSATVTANGVSEVTVTGIQKGAQVMVIGPQAAHGTANGEDIHFTFATAGEYLIVARLFPFADVEVKVNAV